MRFNLINYDPKSVFRVETVFIYERMSLSL